MLTFIHAIKQCPHNPYAFVAVSVVVGLVDLMLSALFSEFTAFGVETSSNSFKSVAFIASSSCKSPLKN